MTRNTCTYQFPKRGEVIRAIRSDFAARRPRFSQRQCPFAIFGNHTANRDVSAILAQFFEHEASIKRERTQEGD